MTIRMKLSVKRGPLPRYSVRRSDNAIDLPPMGSSSFIRCYREKAAELMVPK